MLTGEIRSQINAVWDSFWSGGISNPLEVIEQITYLLFLRRLQFTIEDLPPSQPALSDPAVPPESATPNKIVTEPAATTPLPPTTSDQPVGAVSDTPTPATTSQPVPVADPSFNPPSAPVAEPSPRAPSAAATQPPTSDDAVTTPDVPWTTAQEVEASAVGMYVLLSAYCGVRLVRPRLLGWYRSGWWIVTSSGQSRSLTANVLLGGRVGRIFFKRVLMRIQIEMLSLTLGTIVGCIGGNLYYVATRRRTTAPKPA